MPVRPCGRARKQTDHLGGYIMEKSAWLDGLSRRTALKGMAAGVAALGAPAIIRRASDADPIRVGVISPLTGAWTVYGKAHISGFELEVEEINAAGGVLGRPLEMVVGDSKTEPRIVVEQAKRPIRQRSEERGVGKECVSTSGSRGSPCH